MPLKLWKESVVEAAAWRALVLTECHTPPSTVVAAPNGCQDLFIPPLWGKNSYPLVISHSYWKLPFIVDLPIKKLWFSIIMLVYQEGIPNITAFPWGLCFFCFMLGHLEVKEFKAGQGSCQHLRVPWATIVYHQQGFNHFSMKPITWRYMRINGNPTYGFGPNGNFPPAFKPWDEWGVETITGCLTSENRCDIIHVWQEWSSRKPIKNGNKQPIGSGSGGLEAKNHLCCL